MGEFDGDVYVERVDLAKRVAIVHIDGERLVLGLAFEGAPAGVVGGFAVTPGTSGLSGEREVREGSPISDDFTTRISEGLLHLQEEHPEYFGSERSEADRRALLAARRRIIADAAAAVRPAE